jgi:glycosyltransferase involved in cell wall biosynthesis
MMSPINEFFPLISVYITNYNYGAFIQKSIDSVFDQSFKNWELIIIDDGSTDNSKSIIEKYRNHQKVKIVYQKNKGLNVSNNIALRIADGKYIMRLDADDYLDENALLVLSNKLEENDHLGLVFPDYFLVDSEGEILNIEKRNSFTEDVPLLDQPPHGACTMIRKAALESVGGYDEEFKCQDGYELWVKFTAKYEVANIPTPLFYYRQHGNNLTTNEEKILKTRIRIKEKHLEENKKDIYNSIAIIPVRGSKFNSNHLAFKKLNGSEILKIKIDEALKSKKFGQVIISSPDEEIEEFIRVNYANDKVIFHKRPSELAQLNIGLSGTIESVLDFEVVKNYSPNIICVLSIEYPFSNSNDFDDAINTLNLFETDSLISVRKDNNVYYQHHGKGMQAILGLDKFTKLEREILYQYAGGIIATKTSSYKKTKELINGTVGHIVVSQKSAFRIQTDFDLELAERITEL